MKQADKAQAAAALAAMKKFKLAKAFAVWQQHCRCSKVGRHILCDHLTLHSSAIMLWSCTPDTFRRVPAAERAACSHLELSVLKHLWVPRAFRCHKGTWCKMHCKAQYLIRCPDS